MLSSSPAIRRPVDCCPSKPGLAARILGALAVLRSRRQLAELDQDRLDDLGISPEAAQTEANRAIWDVPAHWVK
ncbi:DUF1127 domain-containing protein [Sulfitobacter pacificus]|uniref:DUF1127 domain-containing protein n=1 Tax=Sulfitobacter pacificus TaxID=1499314 RepID=A0ABQ5VJL2_9RHOB|nr:hypothetical protein [Sulfitobacter pacificus]GLQ27292.1 hypothetical protein GCM10007927_20950 [Sulfitobacter pacificus]